MTKDRDDARRERPRIKLPHGQGSIFWIEAEGCWAADLEVDRDPLTNQRRRRRIRGADPAEVLQRLEEARREHDRGRRAGVGDLTVSQYLAWWLDEIVRPRARPSTLDRYRRAVEQHIAPGLGHIRLARLAPEDAQEWLNALGERGRRPRHPNESAREMPAGLAPRHVLLIRAVLRRALAQALRWGYVARNVATLVDPPTPAAYEATALDGAGARALLKAVRATRLEGVVTIALCLGLRQGEALGLSWADIDLEAGVLRVRKGLKRVDGRLRRDDLKTAHSRRDLPLPRVVRAAIRAQRERQAVERRLAGERWQEQDLVFPTTIGTPWSARNLIRSFARLLAREGLPAMRWHDLRHSAGSLLYEQGVDLPTIMAILGHSQISITADRYLHLGAAAMRRAATAMDRAMGPPASGDTDRRDYNYRSGLRRRR